MDDYYFGKKAPLFITSSTLIILAFQGSIIIRLSSTGHAEQPEAGVNVYP